MVKLAFKKLIGYRISFQKKGIQNTISISLMLLSILGMMLIVLPLYLNFTKTAEHMVQQKNMQLISQTNQYLDSHLRNMMKISDTLYFQVVKNADLSKDSIKESMELLYNSSREHIVSIALFNDFGKVEEAVPLSKLKTSVEPRSNDWFINADNKIEELHFSTPHVQNLFNDPDYRYRWVVSLSRNVEITKGGKTDDGVLLVDMNFSGIERVCRSVDLGNKGYLYLMDKNGEIIYHPRQQLLYSEIEKENNKAVVLHEDGSFTENFNGKKRLVTLKTVGYTGWKIVAITPIADVVVQYGQIRVFVVGIFLFGIFVLCFASILLSAQIAKPIKRLEKSVQKLEKGELDATIAVSGSYEIQHLGKTIRSMVKQMRKLMDDIVVEQEQKRKSELDALQTQINPHFLYNTLDSIVWMIENERYNGAITMVTALARFFRISISKGRSIITVKEELEHARHYLTIQNIRYKNKFSYEVKGDEETLDYACVKLIIQPIIENAIYHGMEYMSEDDEGKIIVTSYTQKGDLYIEVCDNGSGMPPATVESLLEGKVKNKSKGSGIGMRNVHERIQLYFGKEYGITIESEPDEGTKILIHMPLLTIKQVEDNKGGPQ